MKIKNKKGQSGTELLIILAISFVILALVVQAANHRKSETEEMRLFLKKQQLCERLQNEIQNVFLGGEGFQSTITVDNGFNITNNVAYLDGFLCNLRYNISEENLGSNFKVGIGNLKITNHPETNCILLKGNTSAL